MSVYHVTGVRGEFLDSDQHYNQLNILRCDRTSLMIDLDSISNNTFKMILSKARLLLSIPYIVPRTFQILKQKFKLNILKLRRFQCIIRYFFKPKFILKFRFLQIL